MPDDPGERRPHHDAVDAGRGGDGAAQSAQQPAPVSEAVERPDGRREKRRLGVDGAVEKRKREDGGKQRRASGLTRREIQPRQLVETEHRDRECHPGDEDAADVQIRRRSPEQPSDMAHEHRIDGEERNRVAAARRVVVAESGDLKVPPGIVAGERVPEGTGRPEHGELFALIVRKDDVGEEGQNRRPDAKHHARTGISTAGGTRLPNLRLRLTAITRDGQQSTPESSASGAPTWTWRRSERRIYTMPLFEYACRDCGHHFEYLTREGQSPRCPTCAGSELEKQLSVFAVSTSGPSSRRSPDVAGRAVRHVRRSSRPGRLFDQLAPR